jgi:hypothetical protein
MTFLDRVTNVFLTKNDSQLIATQFGLLLEKNNLGKPESDCRGLLHEDICNIKLNSAQELFIVTILEMLYSQNPNPSFLWALGKARKRLVFPWYLENILPEIPRMRGDLGWQALIALENFLNEGFTHEEAKVVRKQLQAVKDKGGPRKEVAMRILNTARDI